uniref:Ig-like domain-containing protein n=1 Tax=Salmo trutta TaxID=8032 RepID=A0A674F3E4_SALTR
MVSGDSVTPEKEEYTPTEGSAVSLRCTYETSSEYIYLYWYRHNSNQAPQFLLYKGARSWSSEEHIPDKRYKSTTSSTSTELVITSLTLADTALYYCALRDYTHVFLLCSSRLHLTIVPSSRVNMHPFYCVKRRSLVLYITCNERN